MVQLLWFLSFLLVLLSGNSTLPSASLSLHPYLFSPSLSSFFTSFLSSFLPSSFTSFLLLFLSPHLRRNKDVGFWHFIWRNKILEKWLWLIGTWNKFPLRTDCWSSCPQSWCSRKTQRDNLGREVGGGFRMRRMHVYLWPIRVDVWQKPSQ